MKFIPSKVHGIFDYLNGLLLIALPFLVLPQQLPQVAFILPAIIGVFIVVMALLTNYELGVAHKIGMANHLMIDNGLGVLLAISPWLFGFFHVTFVFHLVAGIIIVFFGMFTNTLTGTAQYDRKAPGELTQEYLDKK